jgi:NAD+ synthase (glutamine-hydrolysing)
VRAELCLRRATEAGCPLAYVNMVGGQDELVFDGDSIVVGADGTVLARAAQFAEELLVVDLDLPAAASDFAGPVDARDGTTITVTRSTVSTEPVSSYPALPRRRADHLDDCAEVYAAVVTGTRDYIAKNGFQSVVLGLSGGIDSALVAAVAVDAIGADGVHVVGMPSRYSSDHSISDAEELARRLGVHWQLVPIAPIVESYEKTFADIGGLRMVLSGIGGTSPRRTASALRHRASSHTSVLGTSLIGAKPPTLSP